MFGLYTREGFHENFDCPIKVRDDYPFFLQLSYCKLCFTLCSKNLPCIYSSLPALRLQVVALHPQFTKSNHKQFVTGGNKVGLHQTPSHSHDLRHFRLTMIHPDCVRAKPNLTKPSHFGLARGDAQDFVCCVKGSYFSVSLLECSRVGCPFSQSAVLLSTVFERQCFTIAASRCHYQEAI